MDFIIEAMNPRDWDTVRAIYLEGIETGYATFETDPGTWEKWDAAHLKAHRFVARSSSSSGASLTRSSSARGLHLISCDTGVASGDRGSVIGRSEAVSLIAGWAALGPASNRAVYSGVAEVSVYVASGSQGRGIGRALLDALIGSAEKGGIWTLQAMIFPENQPSVALHLRCGFREVGRRDRLGKLHDKWHDVLLLERRSNMVGT